MSGGTPAPVELRRWDAYVDDMDDDHVWLVMADVTEGRDEEDDGREIGRFPRRLLAHLDPRLGQVVTVSVTSDERIVIENRVQTPEEKAEGERMRASLLESLGKLRELAEDDDTIL